MTKKNRTIIGAIALTLVLGCGLIIGNAVLASWAMSSSSEPAQTTQSDTARSSQAEPISAGQAIPLCTGLGTPTQDDAEDETAEANRVYIGMATNEGGQTVIVEYLFDESEREVIANITVEEPDGEVRHFFREGEDAERFVIRVIGQDEYDSWASQVGAPTRADRRDEAEAHARYIPGNPDESEISEETAIVNAIRLLKEKYALRQETIDRFTLTAEFYTRYEDAPMPVWWINLAPANSYDFFEIGSYWALIDSSTGEAVGLFSTADGRG